MKTTLKFPSYLHISGFVAVAESNNIDMDLQRATLTATFNEKELQLAVSSFDATVLWQQLNAVRPVRISF